MSIQSTDINTNPWTFLEHLLNKPLDRDKVEENTVRDGNKAGRQHDCHWHHDRDWDDDPGDDDVDDDDQGNDKGIGRDKGKEKGNDKDKDAHIANGDSRKSSTNIDLGGGFNLHLFGVTTANLHADDFLF